MTHSTLIRDENRLLDTYTIAPGDAPQALGARFCKDEVRLLQANGVYIGDMHTGTVLHVPKTPVADLFPTAAKGR